MKDDFQQIDWDASLTDECEQLVTLAQSEDLSDSHGDLTSAAVIPAEKSGGATFVAREKITVAGLPVAALVAKHYGDELAFRTQVSDGSSVEEGETLAEVEGPVRALLAAERVMLNFLGRLCGIATQTRRYVDAVAGTTANIYDTRKTTPGWRRLEKYAVRCGGGRNHRTGLYDAILIKDNHLAFGTSAESEFQFTPAMAVKRARTHINALGLRAIVEIEVDNLQQLEDVLSERPDIVLLDNMPPNVLRQATQLRDKLAPDVQLESSGGISIDNVRAIALTGVERISIGALTHAARWVDIGLDWLE